MARRACDHHADLRPPARAIRLKKSSLRQNNLAKRCLVDLPSRDAYTLGGSRAAASQLPRNEAQSSVASFLQSAVVMSSRAPLYASALCLLACSVDTGSTEPGSTEP